MRAAPRHLLAHDVDPARWRVPGSRALTLRAVYALHGGSMTSADLLYLARSRLEQPISQIARWVVQREAVQYTLGGEVHFPVFQFEKHTLAVRDEVSVLIRALAPSMGNDDLAEWFVLSHPALRGDAPIERLDDPGALLAAVDTTLADRGPLGGSPIRSPV